MTHLNRGILGCLVLYMIAIAASPASAAEPVTYLRRAVSDVKATPDDLSADKIHYKPIFGIGDAEAQVVKGIARYGEVTIDPGGTTKIVS